MIWSFRVRAGLFIRTLVIKAGGLVVDVVVAVVVDVSMLL